MEPKEYAVTIKFNVETDDLTKAYDIAADIQDIVFRKLDVDSRLKSVTKDD